MQFILDIPGAFYVSQCMISIAIYHSLGETIQVNNW